MDYIQGTQLDHLWPGLDDAARRHVVEKIWRSVKMLHACRPPAELGGVTTASVSGGSVRDGILGVEGSGAISAGPFTSAEDFDDFVKGNEDVEGFPRWPARTGFVHADLTPRNIIVKADGAVCFIDWEFAGWWPLYWERVKWHFTDFPPTPEWVNLMDEISGWARGIQEEE
ncbi:protein kinase-like protein [Ophiocordyceps camponoti-floridani]|uniref:non-specific serine/threonine protein kinase n=1 Tax=Ophiocordyceps camponoti-floridani TaxID=2030778 RepID=A0A8H4Q738_9HYPO|nr:protein kinase-like protein [Ophiocordyceps camponoti-floridani]